jgi:hypothetical protein
VSVFDWFATGVGVAGAAYTFYLTAGAIAWTYGHYPDADNVAGGIVFGAIAAVFWPLVLPCLLIQRHARGGMRTVRYFVVERLMWRPPHASGELVERRR